MIWQVIIDVEQEPVESIFAQCPDEIAKDKRNLECVSDESGQCGVALRELSQVRGVGRSKERLKKYLVEPSTRRD